MGFEGDLDSFGLANVFQTLSQNAQSGSLHVFDDRSERILVFSQGSIRSVTSGDREQIPLGDVLVARGQASPEAIAQAIKKAQVQGKPLSRILLDENIVDEEQVQSALRFVMQEQIFDLFMWHGAKFRFDETNASMTTMLRAQNMDDVPINTSGVVMEALRRLDEWERVQEYVPSMRMIPVVPEENRTPEWLATLKPEEQRVLNFIDGRSTLSRIALESAMGRYATTQFVAKIMQTRYGREATPEELKQTSKTLLTSERVEESQQLLLRLLDLEPENHSARRNLADIQRDLGRNEQAAATLADLANRLSEERNFSEAAAAAVDSVELHPTPEAMMRAARLACLAEDDGTALTMWKRLCKTYEDQGDLDHALEVVTEARELMDANLGLLMLHAHLLEANGDKPAAIAVYESIARTQESRDDVRGAMASYRAILAIDPGYTKAERRLEMLKESRLRVKQQKQRSVALWSGIVILVLMLAGVGVYEAGQYAERQEAAIAIAERQKGFDALTIDEQVRRQQAVVGIWDRVIASPSLLEIGLQASDEVRQEQAKLTRLQRALAEEQRRREGVLTRWDRLRQATHTPEQAEAFSALKTLARAYPESERGAKATRLVAEWERIQAEENQERTRLLTILKDTTNPAPERFAAYQALLRDHPDVGEKPFPGGMADLTVPVQIRTRSNTGVALPATVMINGQPWPEKTPTLVELPGGGGATVFLRRQGYGNARHQTPLDVSGNYEAQVDLTLERAYRWRLRLRGEVIGRPAFSQDGSIVVVATTQGEVVGLYTNDGSEAWTLQSATLAEAVFRNDLLARGDIVYVLGQHGHIAALRASTGEILWPESPAANPVENLLTTGMALYDLPIILDQPAGPGLMVFSKSTSPMFMLDARTGELRWPLNEQRRRNLMTSIGVPFSNAYQVDPGDTFVVLGARGTAHWVLAQGATVERVRLTEMLFQRPGLLLGQGDAPQAIYMTEDGILYNQQLTLKPTFGALPRWVNKDFQGEVLAAPLAVQADKLMLGFDSGRVVWIDPASGQPRHPATFAIPGIVNASGAMVGRDEWILPCKGAGRNPPFIAGVNVTDGKMPVLRWRLALDRGDAPAAIGYFSGSDNKQGKIVTGAGRYVYCLDLE